MLSPEEIKRFIDDDLKSERKRRAAVGERYYEGKHDILKSRLFYYNADGELVEDKARSNIKISHPFFTEISDQLSAYVLSGEQNPIRAKETAEGLQELLDLYFDDEFYAEFEEVLTGGYNKGFDYLYAFKGAEDRLSFQYADGMGVVEIRAKDSDDGCEYIIYHYIDRIDKGKKEIRRIQVWDSKETRYFVQVGGGAVQIDDTVAVNPRPHVVFTDEKGQKMGYGLGYIPFWRYDNNRKQISGLKPIKALIDDYDLHACSLSNNLQDFDTPLHVVMGYQGDNLEELQQNIKTKKIIGVDENGGVEVKTVDIPYQARKEKLEIDEKNIYRFGMALNTAGLKDTAATTNLLIKAAYSLLDLKAGKTIKRAKKFLKPIIKIVLAEINEANGTDYQYSDIYFDFTPSPLINESENLANDKTREEAKQLAINTILSIAANVGDEKTLQAICEVMEWDFEELRGEVEKMQEAQKLLNAENELKAVVPEEGILAEDAISGSMAE